MPASRGAGLLAVPKLNIGRANVAAGAASAKIRYVETRRLVQDESAGGNEQEVALRDMNVRLLLSTEDLGGYEVLPIAQVERAGEREAAPQLDPTYFPPVLAIDAWPPLGRDIVRAIYDIIGKKIEVLAEQVVNRGISLVSQEPGDLDRLLMLHAVERGLCHAPRADVRLGRSPLDGLCRAVRIVGQLSLFGPQRRPPEIPRLRPRRPGQDLPLGQGADRAVARRNPRLRIRAAVLRGRGARDAGLAGIAVAGGGLAVVRRRDARGIVAGAVHRLAVAGGLELEAGEFAASGARSSSMGRLGCN